jgi:GNAT superfamily N-acetyltransferase
MSDDPTGAIVVEITAEETHALRGSVLRSDTPSTATTFPEDDWPGTFHLGVRRGAELVAISTWIPRPFPERPAVPAIQLRGMATAPELQGTGLGAVLLDEGCRRAAATAALVWARARDAALAFYLRHGFTVVGEGFVDETTGKPHHLIVRQLHAADV